MKKGSVIGIVILSMLLVIGFANTTANIIVNNSTSIIFNENFFNIYITNQTGDGTITLSEDRREIYYVSKSLSTVGDTSILEYEVVNDSSQYDANVLLETTLDSNSNKYRVTYETIDDSNPYLLSSKRKVKAKITIELIEQVNNPLEANINIKLILTALGRTEEGKESYTIIYDGNGATSGTMPNQEVELDKEDNLLTNTYTKEGYQFLAWSTTPNSNDNYYLDGQNIINIGTSGNTVTLYALWLKNNYDYTGSEQTMKALLPGKYKLEIWGAQGGSVSNFIGGYGAYATGVVNLNKNNTLYLSVGGSGGGASTNANYPGGFNGGGVKKFYSTGRIPTSGGGATHIALRTGELHSFQNPTNASSSVLLVAGGGGGATYQSTDTCGNGGHGGGYIGNAGTPGSACAYAINERRYGTGGNQSTGGITSGCYNKDAENKGTFGRGATYNYSLVLYHISGGGGGWYGGGADGCAGPGGRGSGWINSSNLISSGNITKHMTCYNCSASTAAGTRTTSNTCVNSTPTADCSKIGNGYARITYLG